MLSRLVLLATFFLIANTAVAAPSSGFDANSQNNMSVTSSMEAASGTELNFADSCQNTSTRAAIDCSMLALQFALAMADQAVECAKPNNKWGCAKARGNALCLAALIAANC